MERRTVTLSRHSALLSLPTVGTPVQVQNGRFTGRTGPVVEVYEIPGESGLSVNVDLGGGWLVCFSPGELDVIG